jgi:leucyl/phenylalanyl-tRNA--protein transferase
MIPVTTLLAAYRYGFFPMGVGRSVEWFSPDPRGILPLDRFHVPRRLARVIRQGKFTVTVDRAFEEVIGACARADEPDQMWITEEIRASYIALHRLGFAHSIETWYQGELAGGLYGVSLRGAFFGESMFHRVSDASKVALCALVERLRARGYRLLDVQWVTPHLARFGAVEIPRAEYLARLEEAMGVECEFA